MGKALLAFSLVLLAVALGCNHNTCTSCLSDSYCSWCPATASCSLQYNVFQNPCISGGTAISEKSQCPATSSTAPSNPLVLIPGIGGSILDAYDSSTGHTQRAWVNLLSEHFTFSNLLGSTYNPTTDISEPTNPDITISVPLTNNGLDGITVLDPDALLDVEVAAESIWYFQDMVNQLEGNGYVSGQNLWGLPYDWRQDNGWSSTPQSTQKRLQAVLQDAMDQNNGAKVDVITHSMGCYVFRAWMVQNPQLIEQYINKWISVACPFQGAAGKIFETFFGQYDMGNSLVATAIADQSALQSPSSYQLLPNPYYKWPSPPQLTYTVNGQTQTFTSENIGNAFDSINDNFIESLFTSAHKLYQKFDAIEMPAGMQHWNIMGVEVPTHGNITFTGSVSDASSLWGTTNYNPSTVSGDGTVIAESAVSPPQFAAIEQIQIPGVTHVGLLKNQECINKVLSYLQAPSTSDNDYVEDVSYTLSATTSGVLAGVVSGAVACVIIVVAIVVVTRRRRFARLTAASAV